MSDSGNRAIKQQEFERKWRRYSATSVALLAANAVYATVPAASVESTTSSGSVGTGNSFFNIDIDGDGLDDFKFSYVEPLGLDAGSMSTITVPGPLGGSSTVQIPIPDNASVPGHILFKGLSNYIGSGSFEQNAIFKNPNVAALSSVGPAFDVAQIHASSNTLIAFSSLFGSSSSLLLTTEAVLNFSNGDGTFSSAGIQPSGSGLSFIGVALTRSSGTHLGYIAVNSQSNGLDIVGWGYNTIPDSALHLAAPVPEVGAVGGLAALALGAAGVRNWRRRRTETVSPDGEETPA